MLRLLPFALLLAACDLIYPYAALVAPRGDGGSARIDGASTIGDARADDASIRGDLAPPPAKDGASLPLDAASLPPDAGVFCAPEGLVPASCASSGEGCCDPVGQTGCPGSFCYMTNLGPGCVCVAGVGTEGVPCVGPEDCFPGLGCTDTEPPTGTSICRRVCTMGTFCPAGQACAPALANFPTIGVCP